LIKTGDYVVRFQSRADAELKAAFAWYEDKQSGLGDEFLRAVAVIEEILSRDPTRFAVTATPYRWAKMRKFPYGIHYWVDGKTVWILACLHFKQSTERWPQPNDK
jgi:toxin ParE1/3/4